jgi:hypothetical protein
VLTETLLNADSLDYGNGYLSKSVTAAPDRVPISARLHGRFVPSGALALATSSTASEPDPRDRLMRTMHKKRRMPDAKVRPISTAPMFRGIVGWILYRTKEGVPIYVQRWADPPVGAERVG